MKIFNLPDLGEGLPDAEIREWHVSVGDIVEIDQVLVTVETAKALVDIPSPYAGKIIKLHGDDGDIIPTGEPLIEFESDEEEEAPKEDQGTVVGKIEVGSKVLNEDPMGVGKNAKSNHKIKAAPAIRAFAKKMGVDLQNVTPTGPNNSITRSDVQSAASQAKGVFQPLKGMRRAMALKMEQAHSEVVPVTIVEDVDIHQWPSGSDLTIRVVRAIIAGCKEVPLMNAHYDHSNQTLHLFDQINIGIAVDSESGLYVPVLKDVSSCSDDELRNKVDDFKSKAQKNRFPQEDMQGASIGFSNYGSIAGKYANPIIVPPMVAILGVGHARDEVVAYQGKPAIHRILPLTLTYDHRPLTGGEATRFLAIVVKHLEEGG